MNIRDHQKQGFSSGLCEAQETSGGQQRNAEVERNMVAWARGPSSLTPCPSLYPEQLSFYLFHMLVFLVGSEELILQVKIAWIKLE